MRSTPKRLRGDRSAGTAALLLALTAIASGCGTNRFEQELATERAAIQLTRETARGEYSLISTDELVKLLASDEDFVLVDAMPESSFQTGHILGAVNFEFPKEAWQSDDELPLTEAARTSYAELLGEDKDRLIVVYCGFVACGRSHNGAVAARQLGYQNVRRYPGGIHAWRGAGQALVTP